MTVIGLVLAEILWGATFYILIARNGYYVHTNTPCLLTHTHQLMGIEVDTKYGGPGGSFFSSILAIEELARVDPSVSVMCDVQNTLIYEYLHRYASEELKQKYFPRITSDMVGSACLRRVYLHVF